MKSFNEIKRNLRADASHLPEIRVALLGDTATQLLATAIRGEGYERGYNINLFEAEYSQVERQLLDTSSDLYAHNAQYTIIFQSTHRLLEEYTKSNDIADRRLAFVRTVCESVTGKIIYYNYPETGDGAFGSYGNKVPSSFIYQLRKLNYELMNLAQEFPNLFICDLSELQAKYGRDYFFDSSVYVNTEMILSIDALPLVASRTLDIICAIEGKMKKCLIVDLDNTIWGGVVGDDGWENLELGHGLGIGKAFTEFQQWIKRLKERGVIVCVCSKNDEEKAKEPFLKNPDMVLKLDDIALFVANWKNKADNIRAIQQALNIGFESMVFLDDNPFERNLVRENIPGITVPELPEDPADYLETLYSLNLFETASYSDSDKQRTQNYQADSLRVAAASSFTNEEDYLKSLEMCSEVTEFNCFNTPRIAQLSQRSNQFNLRTIRYTEEQVTDIKCDPGRKCLAFTLKDCFGDNGLIAVVVLRVYDTKTLFVENWFMSCRVLNRGMEEFTLNTIVAIAMANRYKRIVGEYLPTAKNGIVADLYPRLGFSEMQGKWLLDVDSYYPKKCYISIK